MFVDRVKNDPAFAAQAFKLQAAIKEASAPQNIAQTHFGTNDGLSLDLREWTEGGIAQDGIAGVRKTVDGVFSAEERWEDEELRGGRRQQLTQKERDEEHARYTEVKAVAQTLAFRVLDGFGPSSSSSSPVSSSLPSSSPSSSSSSSTSLQPDTAALRSATRLFNLAYDRSESASPHSRLPPPHGNVAFRHPCDVLGPSALSEMLSSPGVECMVAEVPNGRGAVSDGAVIGAACYVVSGAGKAGIKACVSLLAVDPRFWHLYVGSRLLAKVERRILNVAAATAAKEAETGVGQDDAEEGEDGDEGGKQNTPAPLTVPTFTCLPSPSQGTAKWLGRQGYRKSSGAAYPFDAVPFEILPAFKEESGGNGEKDDTSGTTTTPPLLELGVYCKMLSFGDRPSAAKSERDSMLPESGFAGPRRAEKIREQVRETMDIFDAAEAAKRGIAWS